MDGLIEELFRLEQAKQDALISVDSSAYEAGVHEQLRLLSSPHDSVARGESVECLRALSQLIATNARLLQNLLSTTPLFDFRGNYTAGGRVLPEPLAGRVSVEA
jgi:hypothetical protein